MLSYLRGNNRIVRGKVRCGHVTKQVVSALCPGDIAIISHTNIDELAARELIERGVGAVVNCAVSFTGDYEAQGARVLLEHCIPLYDCPSHPDLLTQLSNGENVIINGHYLFRERDQSMVTRLAPVTPEQWEALRHNAEKNMPEQLKRFVENTLRYAEQEKKRLFTPLVSLPLCTSIAGRPALIVSRGKYYKEDLHALSNYIVARRPALIGVDGGGDALLEQGWCPDIIMGDMDSVSDKALRAAQDIVVHGYMDGSAPGAERVKQLGLAYHVLPAPGTSEDMALLYAYDNGADLLISVGAHSAMGDFLEKGRQGMASTLLVRMKVGGRLVDAKGLHHLYPKSGRMRLPLLHYLKTWV
ncbi:putative cytokinetic ring protein SteA [Aneurinibacillus thermoaerophilus]|uniref:putative cytokinetic ring protein SteA n=1 Tax=Aneurinibacillus thermoaerophilus TaxID=143495 RepID=UPI002E23D8CF|nr:putative cytokinetic ring protein SteA [Aneurinibacillus thermoaerophilus]MED0737930.1 putative cytokinetic ring protein SteA [Aneurinibacillus thermoaerophilus]